MPQTQNRQPSEIDRLLVDYTSRRLDEEADRQGVPRDFAGRVLGAESGGRADVISGRRRSSAGAIGPMQLMPGTADDLGVDPYNIDENVEGGVRYLKQHLRTFGGDRARAAAAYNAGPSRVKKYGGVPPFKETRDYVRKVAGQEQGGSEIDRLYDQFTGGQRKSPTEPEYDERGRRKIGARDVGITPVEWPEGKVLRTSTGEFIEPSQQSKYAPLQSLRPDARRDEPRSLRRAAPPPAVTRDALVADVADQMRQREMKEGAIAETRARLGKLSNAELRKEHARLTKIFGTVPETAAAHAEEERRRAEYYAKPLHEQVGREILGGMAEAGAGIGRAVHRVTDPINRALGYGAELDRQLAEEAESERKLAEETALANRLRSKVVRGVSAATGQIATAAPVAMGAGPVGVTALTALESDVERDPGGALASTIAAPVSIAAGRAVSPFAGRAASAFTSPVARKAAQLAVEAPAGAAANVAQYVATAKALGRPVTDEDLIEQAVTGGVISGVTAPGGLRSLRPSAREIGGATSPGSRAAMEVTTRPRYDAERMGDAGIRRAIGRYAERVDKISKTATDPQTRELALESAREVYLAERDQAAQLRQGAQEPTGQMEVEPARRPPQQREQAIPGRPTAKLSAASADDVENTPTAELPAVIHPNPEIDRKPILAKTQDDRVIVENPNNKSGVSVVKDRSDEPAEHKFSSTQANLPKDLADEITAFGRRIPDRDLAGDGRETTPHITLKYGLHGWDPKIAQEALAGEGPVKVKFGKTSVFQNDDADVVKVSISSPDLHRLNQKIADAHPNTETHPTYEPHATIAYVRPGQGRKYAGSNFLEGKTITLDRITFSGRDGKQVEIPLTGRKTSTPAEVAGEPVSPRWLNAQRRRAAELLGLDPDQIPMADEASGAALQNLQTPQARTDVGQASTNKPKFVADAERRLRDVVTGRTAGSGGQALFDMAVVAGHRVYRAGMDFAQWSREVIRSAGDEVRPHLRKAWDAITEHVSFGPDRRPPSSGQVLGSGPGALQGLFERVGRNKPPKGSEPEPTGLRGRVFETIGAAQTVSQLASPGFVLRNFLQHASHGAQEMAVQGIAGLTDRAVSVITGKRTVGGFRNPIEFAREAGRFMTDYAEGVREARASVKRGEPLPGSRLKDMPDPETLTAFGRKLQKVLTYINEVPDAGNWNAHFKRSMRDQSSVLKSSWARSKPSTDKAIQQVDRMIERAWAEADHASMRDKNFASKALGDLKKFLNARTADLTGTDKFGLGDFVVKYVQIPGSLVKKGIEFSPLGIIESGYYATKGDQRRAVQSLSRAVVGSTTGVGVGAALAALGVFVGPERDKGQLAQLEREEGVRGYSINMSALKRLAGGGWDDPESGKLKAGDRLVGVDWLQPWSLQASVGAAVYNLYKQGKLGPNKATAGATGEAVYNSLAKALDVMGDQSVLKNVGRYWRMSNGDTDGERFLSFLRAVGVDVPSSFVPSLARQVRQVVDPYERDTRAEEPEGFRGFAEEATNRALAQLPGVSERFPTRPSVLTGAPRKTAIGEYSAPVRGLRMLSPAPFSTYTPSDVAGEAARLTDAGFKVAFSMPKREKGERTSDLRRREERFADTFASQAPKLLNHPFYRLASDEAKAEAFNDLAKQLRAATRKTIDAKTVDEIIDRAGDRVENRRDRRGR